jgi:hypothetical protein
MKDFFKNFLNRLFVAISICGVVVTMLISFANEFFEEFRYYIFTHAIYLTLGCAAVYTLWGMTKPKFAFVSPKIIRVYKEDKLILAEESDWMGIRTALAIYIDKDGLERLVCGAVVINVQSDRLVQLEIIKLANDPTEVNDIMKRIEDSQKSVIIRPGVYHG